MTPYDACMAGVIVAGMVWGAVRGITWQLASLASLILGYAAAHTLSGQLVGYFPGDPAVARALAMIAVYLGTSAGIFLAAWLVRATLKKLKFEAYDRHLGMVLGGLEGGLLGLVVTLFVVSLAPGTRAPIFGSPTGQVVGRVMAAVGPLLPEEPRKVLDPFLNGATEGPAAGPLPALSVAAPAPALNPAPASTSAEAGRRDDATGRASLGGLIEQAEARVGKAVEDEASKALRQATDGATAPLNEALGRAENSLQQVTGGGGNGGTVERR